MNHVLKGTLTVLILIAINMGMASMTEMAFMDLMFFVGLIVTIVIGFFSSSGGFTTQYTDFTVGNATMDEERQQNKKTFKLSTNVPFWIAFVYSIIGLLAFVVIVIRYW